MQAVLGLSGQDVELIQSIIDSHFSFVRGCLKYLFIWCLGFGVAGMVIIYIFAGDGDDKACAPYNCGVIGDFMLIVPWVIYIAYAIAYYYCIVEAKNEKASSDLNLRFQDHRVALRFKLSQSIQYQSFQVDPSEGAMYSWHSLEISLGH